MTLPILFTQLVNQDITGPSYCNQTFIHTGWACSIILSRNTTSGMPHATKSCDTRTLSARGDVFLVFWGMAAQTQRFRTFCKWLRSGQTYGMLQRMIVAGRDLHQRGVYIWFELTRKCAICLDSMCTCMQKCPTVGKISWVNNNFKHWS